MTTKISAKMLGTILSYLAPAWHFLAFRLVTLYLCTSLLSSLHTLINHTPNFERSAQYGTFITSNGSTTNPHRRSIEAERQLSENIEQESSTLPDMQQAENKWILVDRENVQLSII
jgi:hypothetical protein